MKAQPIPKIKKRLRKGPKPKKGQKVLVTRLDGTQYIAEVMTISQKVKNWITQVKRVDDDGKVTVEEVADLVVEAVIIVKDIILTEVFKAIAQWFKNLFKRKNKK